MKIHSIDAGSFLCDGGGIFGGVPKILWSRHIQADERNLIRLSMRCLLVEEGNRKVLIETGAGDKLSWKFIENNGVSHTHRLIESLKAVGYSPEDISDVVHTHLHWDHAGGGTTLNDKKKAVPTFPNATYHCARSQWKNALNPNVREGDAYFENDLLPVQQSGRLNLIDRDQELFPGFELRIFNGHTLGQIIPIIDYNDRKIVFVSDLVPTVANIPLKWVAAYDLYPVTTMEEKENFLREAFENKYLLFFNHDMQYECSTVAWHEEKGPKSGQKGALRDFINK